MKTWPPHDLALCRFQPVGLGSLHFARGRERSATLGSERFSQQSFHDFTESPSILPATSTTSEERLLRGGDESFDSLVIEGGLHAPSTTFGRFLPLVGRQE